MVDEPLRASVARVQQTWAQAYEPDLWYGAARRVAFMSNKPISLPIQTPGNRISFGA